MPHTVRYELIHRIALITLDHPDQRNAIDAAMTATASEDARAGARAFAEKRPALRRER